MFPTFADHDDDVDAAIAELNGGEWNGRRLLVERARHVRCAAHSWDGRTLWVP